MKKIITLLFLFMPFYGVNAQELITTTGGAESGAVWSVGEIITATLTDANASLTQGFVQPGMKLNSAIAYPQPERLEVNVYPNPVTDHLRIHLEDKALYSWKIYDSLGRTLDAGDFSGKEANIDFSKYKTGYYILSVASPQEMQTIKVVKI